MAGATITQGLHAAKEDWSYNGREATITQGLHAVKEDWSYNGREATITQGLHAVKEDWSYNGRGNHHPGFACSEGGLVLQWQGQPSPRVCMQRRRTGPTMAGATITQGLHAVREDWSYNGRGNHLHAAKEDWSYNGRGNHHPGFACSEGGLVLQ